VVEKVIVYPVLSEGGWISCKAEKKASENMSTASLDLEIMVYSLQMKKHGGLLLWKNGAYAFVHGRTKAAPRN